MDFGSSHVFTQADSDTEELTPDDFNSGIYQPVGATLPALRNPSAPSSSVSQPEVSSGESDDDAHEYNVLYDNVIRDQQGTRPQSDDPIYDNRGSEATSKPELPARTSGDYASPYDSNYDVLNRQSHPYEYAGPGYGTGVAPPPLPPMRKQEPGHDPMMEDPEYGGIEGEYMTLLRKGSSKLRRADTNIVAVKFDKLVQSEHTETGSPVFCGCCGAAMSSLSKISTLYSGKFWVCEFCEFENPVAEGLSLPSSEDSMYVMGQGSGGGDDTIIIFCMDVSGSMAVTTEVSGDVKGPINDSQMALQAYQEEWDAAEQRRRQAQEEALHAQMMADYGETIDQQAQALAQFHMSRTDSASPSMASPSIARTESSPMARADSRPMATAPPREATLLPSPAQSSVQAAAQGGGGGGGDATASKGTDIDERYVAAPRKPAPPPPEPRKHVSYVSRLQAMQSAIQQQVTKLGAGSSHKRVGLVAFNNDVTVIGDGTLDPIPLEGAGLLDREGLICLGQNFPIPEPISKVQQSVSEKIYSLTESGQTSLGPALLIAISMASQKPGSKVIMCTDGMANVGLGALSNMENDSVYEQASAFYEEVANFARDAGVCVSVLTLEGEDCRAIELGRVADKTRGQVNIVKPNDLNQQFADILADPILATNVSAKMVLHKGLFLRDSEGSSSESQATHIVGLVTADSETTFEFGVRKKEVIYDNFGGMAVTDEREKEEPIYESVNQTMIDGLERLPFQVQIRFSGRDGQDFLRVLTMDRPVTKDRKFAEQNANVGVIGAHAAQSAAKLAVEGHYAKAQINALVTQKLVQRCTQPEEGNQQEGIYQTFLANMAPIHTEITKAQQHEFTEGEYEKLEASHTPQPKAEASPHQSGKDSTPLLAEEKTTTKKMKQRRKNVSDRQASVFYRMKGATTNMFNKKTYNLGDAEMI